MVCLSLVLYAKFHDFSDGITSFLSYKAGSTTKAKNHKNNMWCALLAPLHLSTQFLGMMFRYFSNAFRKTDARCYCSYHKYCKDGQSGILMPFGVQKQISTLAAYGKVTPIKSSQQYLLFTRKNMQITISVFKCTEYTSGRD